MSDERKRRGEWAPLLDAWPAPSPPRGFADRVIAACEAPAPPRLAIVREPPPRAPSRGGWLVAAALAAALILVPLAFQRHPAPPVPAAAVATGDSADLGSTHD
jgi:hypothetical protein